MATDGESSFVFFLYPEGGIEWDFPGQVGLNAGDGIRFFSHPDSFSSRLTNIHTTTNVGTPGVWIFRVDGSEIVPAGCSNQNSGNFLSNTLHTYKNYRVCYILATVFVVYCICSILHRLTSIYACYAQKHFYTIYCVGIYMQ